MRSVDRVLAAIHFDQVDRLPRFLQMSGFAATSAGVDLTDYLTKSKVLVSSQLSAARRFQNDFLFASLDYCVEAEALGTEITFNMNAYPHILSPLLEKWQQVGNLSIPDPNSSGRMPVILEACQQFLDQDDGEHFIVGQVMGPTTIATQILGIENALYLLVDEPEGFARILEFTAQVTQRFAEAVLAVGVHGVMINEPSASPNVIPKEVFSNTVLPILKLIFKELKRKYGGINWLQITGNTTRILPFYRGLEIDLVTVDSPVNLNYALGTLATKTVCGHLSPFLFLEGRQEQIKAALDDELKEGRKLGYILGSGCEIPLDSNPLNLEYLIRQMGC